MIPTATGILLSTAYFPPIQYFSMISGFKELFIEKHENYSKQSYRNRCNILSANGMLPLVIPVKRLRGTKTSISDIRPDNSYNWQRLHSISIASAYRSAPFYEYYIDDIKPFFDKKFNFLLDLNTAILDKLLSVLKISVTRKFTSEYIDDVPTGIIDLRDEIHPKSRNPGKNKLFKPVVYPQVFQEKHGFRQDLSIIDLLFNTGPDARSIIEKSLKT